MPLTDGELDEVSKHLTDAEAILAVLPQKPSQITAELGLGVVRGALFALDESAADATHAARTLQKFQLQHLAERIESSRTKTKVWGYGRRPRGAATMCGPLPGAPIEVEAGGGRSARYVLG